jgi:hypothetical protein
MSRFLGVMGRFRLTLVFAGALALLPVPVAAAAAPGPTEAPAASPDGVRPYSLVVGQRADFVAQTNFVQCVGASMQMMINMIEPGRDRTALTQRRLQDLARRWSGPRPDGFQRRGASVRGWATGLTLLGVGPYRLVGTTSLQAALRTAAKAIRETGKPVGLLVWRGRHAWVMSGFTATADPRTARTFTVTGANVHDPLYPYGSSVWGRSPRPGELLTPAEVGQQFKPRRANGSAAMWAGLNPWSTLGGKYVLVLPYEPRPFGAWAARYR